MAGSLNQFLSSFKTDLARPNRFDVNIPAPIVLFPYVGDTRRLVFRCESTEIPGKSLSTTDRKIGSSPIEKMPYLTNYNDITMDFIVDDNMSQRLFFEAWFQAINPTTNYNFRYKSDYAVDIDINQYNVTGNKSYIVTLREAFPIGINQMDLNWSSDGYHKISVQFAFTEWVNLSSAGIGKSLVSQGASGLVEELTSGRGLSDIMSNVKNLFR